jgi:hypothetical protein
MTKCENINMKKIEQSYGARSYYISIEDTKDNVKSCFYLYPFGDLVQKKFY